MTETREFPTAVLASITTGRVLCKFGDIHEAAEFVMGHQIWTHHFTDPQLAEDMKKTVLSQCPTLPTKIDGLSETNWQEKLAALEQQVGKSFTVRKGSGLTAMHPIDGIPPHVEVVALPPVEGE